jgi:hypothetical protein
MRARQKFNAGQRVLFDQHGFIPFDFLVDAVSVPGCKDTYEVEGMHFVFLPRPRNLPRAMDYTLDAMRALYLLGPQRWNRRGGMDPIKLDTWQSPSAIAVFRMRHDRGEVLAIYYNGKLELSLPHPRIWSEVGLGWLYSYRRCCERNQHDPTPWLGRKCGCGP